MDYLKRTWAEIDIDALLHNFKTIKAHTFGKIAAVVKADAYGHGASIVAPILEKAGADMFAVSNIEEALELRRVNIKKPILILGYTPIHYAKTLATNDIIQTVYSLPYAQKLSTEAGAANIVVKCHLKADTGMSRLGFDCRDDALLGLNEMAAAARLDGIKVCGVFTHFATADRDNDAQAEFTNAQYTRFNKVCEALKQKGIDTGDCHCCNSAGLMLHSDKHIDMSRPGIILYGLTPSANLPLNLPLKAVMSFKSVVSFVKHIKAGDTVSYGRNFTAKNDMTVATIPVGYADGYPRILSGKGEVVIRGKKARILGNVCMDQLVVDISNIEGVCEGDEVTLFGSDMPVEKLAQLCNTINYELICGVSRRVPRVYLKDGKEIMVADYILDRNI